MKQIKIKEKEEKMIVDVALPPRLYASDASSTFTNSELLEYLKQENIEIEEYELESQTHPYLTTYCTKGIPATLEGTWIFSKKQEEKLNKKKPRTYNKRKDKKTGD